MNRIAQFSAYDIGKLVRVMQDGEHQQIVQGVLRTVRHRAASDDRHETRLVLDAFGGRVTVIADSETQGWVMDR